MSDSQWGASARAYVQSMGNAWRVLVVDVILASVLAVANFAGITELNHLWWIGMFILGLAIAPFVAFRSVWLRVQGMERRSARVAQHDNVAAALDQYHTKINAHAKDYEDFQLRLKFMEGQTNYVLQEQRLNELYESSNRAADDVLLLRDEIAGYIEGEPLLGAGSRAEFLASGDRSSSDDVRAPVLRIGRESARYLRQLMKELEFRRPDPSGVSPK